MQLTNISWRSTGCGHDSVVGHLRKAKVTDHDLCVLILVVVQQVLWLLRERKREMQRK